MTPNVALLVAAAYVVLGRLLVGIRARWAEAAFALLNLAAAYLFFFFHKQPGLDALLVMFFLAYVALVSVQYVAMRRWSRSPGRWPWVAFAVPIAALVVIRYAPIAPVARLFSGYIYNVLVRHPEISLGWAFVGISYLAFRTSYLVLEVRNGTVPPPGYWRYMGFAFFAPTMWVGPISPYHLHREAFEGETRPQIPIGRAALRVLVGAVKYKYLGALFNQLTYSGLLLDGHPHPWIDLPVAMFAYYLYLYCNFSGFCDIAIGGAGLMGVPVAENFDVPFAARNMKDFWNRWHITLSEYMRDVVFSPLSKTFVRIFGPTNVNHAIALTIFIVFILVGVWHGVGWNYFLFGVANAVGVVGNHYYTVALKKRLGKERFAAYNRSRVVHAVCVAFTFVYVSACLFLFANSLEEMRTIFQVLH